MAKSKIDIIYDMVNLAYDVKRQWSKDKDSIWLGDYARAVIKAKDEKVYDKFVDLTDQLKAEGWDEFVDACKYLIDEYNQFEESKKSMKESINDDCYIYFDDNGEIYGKNRRWVFCDNVKGITNTRDFFPLNDFIIDAIHIFKNEKQAQKFIDVDCKYFEDKNKLVIAEYPQTVSGFFESKESATKSIKESKDITIEEFISDYKNNDCFSIRDKENGHESECFWGSKKDVLDSDYRLFTVLDTDVNKETDDVILYIDLEENAWVESKKSARKSIEESKVMTFEEFKKLCNDNFSYAIMDFHEYKGAYFVIISADEKTAEKFTKILHKNGLECSFYELQDPYNEYYLCYEIMCV